MLMCYNQLDIVSLLFNFIKNDIKEYVAKMTFGYTSDTLDIWGNLEEFEVE